MSDKKYIAKMIGYKATNKNMVCSGGNNGVSYHHQFEVGKWCEIEGEIELCKRGFHFCIYPSGPWAFYSAIGTRVFKVEAEQVLEIPTEAGADFKLVAKRIRLIEEITPGGDLNTGNLNTGDLNTGNLNTGNRNTGNRNTGNRNTGNLNTGDWNTANNSSGFFCATELKVISFDIQTKLTREQYFEKYPEVYQLGELLMREAEIDFFQFEKIPGITKEKLKKLHASHLAARRGKS